jgi:hypothetical protein
MRRSPILLLSLIALFTIPVVATAQVHWARDTSSFTLTIHENLGGANEGDWEDALDDVVDGGEVYDAYDDSYEWYNGWNEPIDNLQVAQFCILWDTPVTAPRNCTSKNGAHELCSAKFGTNMMWRALTKLFVSGQHITRANTRMNDSFFNNALNSYDQRRHALCRELGLVLGLSVYGDGSPGDMDPTENAGSCMDLTDDPWDEGEAPFPGNPPGCTIGVDCIDDPTPGYPPPYENNEFPSYDDFASLEDLYEHADTFNSYIDYCGYEARSANALRPPTMEEILSDEDESWGVPIRFDRKGRPVMYAKPSLDGKGAPQLELTHVNWASETEIAPPKRRGVR